MTVHYFFRDTLAIDDSLLDRLDTLGITPAGGDTLVLGAANCQLTNMSGAFDYVILAGTLTTAAAITVTPARIDGGSVSIFADSIATPFSLNVPGDNGADGEPGADGQPGEVVDDAGKPRRLPGEAGGDGAAGGPGGTGGTVSIRYGADASVPTANVPGGPGGHGGHGGAGGGGWPPGNAGRAGRPGIKGRDGSAVVTLVSSDDVYTGAPGEAATRWSAYRTEVGEYLFRLFDPGSQLHALAEFDAALLLDPTNVRADTLRQRIIQQETPGGTSRDLDVAPDYKDIAAGLLGETQLVLSDFLAVQQAATQQEIAAATKDQLSLVLGQLSDRLTEAQLDVVSANDGVQVANAERQMYSTQYSSLQQQIITLQDQHLSLGDLVTTLGAVASAVTGLVTGAGAIVAIPAALAAEDDPKSGVAKVLQFLIDGKSFWNDKDVGDDLSGLLKGGQDGITNFSKVYSELSGSANDSAIKQLAMQQAILGMQEMVAQLRQTQAKDQLVAAETRVSDAAAEVQAAEGLLGSWSVTDVFIAGALVRLLTVARRLADIVAEDIFLARRAQEVYELDDASSVRFDYGHLHPDLDNDLVVNPLQRVQRSLEGVSALPAEVISWNQIFVRLNEAQTSGYDIVHPVLEVVINDAAALDHLRAGGGLKFSLGIGPDPVTATIPATIYELKVDNMHLQLTGASATGAALIWMQHSGHWVVKRRPTAVLPAPPDVEFMLFSHIEAFNVAAGTNLTAAIPAQPQSSVEPGPPFSFWGRGALADWTLFTDQSATALNLSGLSEVRIAIGCIGLVAHGAVAPATLRIAPTPSLLTVDRSLLLAHRAAAR
jgi:hypothetical protein